MKRQKNLAGYTIIEVMIFLIVSGGLLLSAMTLIGGQQGRTQFNTGVNEFESKMQDIINDVETGVFPAANDLKCTVPGMESNADAAPSITKQATEQGTNENCVYMGKVIQFYKDSAGVVTQYRAVTIAGKRLDYNNATGKMEEPASIEAAKPTAYRDPINTANSGLDIARVPFGIEVSKVSYVTNYSPFTTSGNSKEIGIVPSITLRSKNNTISNLGAGRASLANVDGVSNFNDNIGALYSSVGTLNDTNVQNARLGAIICLRDAPGGRVAAVTIGVQLSQSGGAFVAQATNQQLSTQIFVDARAKDLGCTS